MHDLRVLGIDHFGVTVPCLEEAVDELRHVLDARLCYVEGPLLDGGTGRLRDKLGAREATSLRVAAVTVAGVNLELFDWGGRPDAPAPGPRADGSDPFGLVVRGDAASALVRRPGIEGPCSPPDRSSPLVVRLRCGLQVLAVPGDRRLPHEARPVGDVVSGVLTLPDQDFDRALRDLRAVFGLGVAGPVTEAGATLRGAQGASVVVLRGHGRGGRPAVDEPGGHHLALGADDVDAVVQRLDPVPGYASRGRPETIDDGPIAGDRWVYVDSPFGVQLEIIHMPDGSLPYEQGAEALRTPLRRGGAE